MRTAEVRCVARTGCNDVTDNPVVWFPRNLVEGPRSPELNPDGGAYGLVGGSNNWIPRLGAGSGGEPDWRIADKIQHRDETTLGGDRHHHCRHRRLSIQPAIRRRIIGKHQAVSLRAYNSLLGSSAETPGGISPNSYTLDPVSGTTQVYLGNSARPARAAKRPTLH